MTGTPQSVGLGAQVAVGAATWAPDCGEEAGGEPAPGGERDVLAEDDEDRGLEGVGAAGHAQVRPGSHERAGHRVAGERGDAGCGVEVEPEPAASRGVTDGDGIRVAGDVGEGTADGAGRQRHGECRGVRRHGPRPAACGGSTRRRSTSTSSSPGTACATRNARSAGRSTSSAVTGHHSTSTAGGVSRSRPRSSASPSSAALTTPSGRGWSGGQVFEWLVYAGRMTALQGSLLDLADEVVVHPLRGVTPMPFTHGAWVDVMTGLGRRR